MKKKLPAAPAPPIEAFRLPRYRELTNVGLYLEQTVRLLNSYLAPLGEGESLITVTEGRYHQVRRMMASRGLPVTYLERRKEGPLSLGDLPRGACRLLSEEEITKLER